MAVRVTAKEVRSILDNSSLPDSIVNSYITGANALINSALGTGTTDLLKEIERWLSAHMIACTVERVASKEGAGGAFIEYTGKYDQGLKSTSYGQMVATLDTSGVMAGLMGKSAKITAIKSFE